MEKCWLLAELQHDGGVGLRGGVYHNTRGWKGSKRKRLENIGWLARTGRRGRAHCDGARSM